MLKQVLDIRHLLSKTFNPFPETFRRIVCIGFNEIEKLLFNPMLNEHHTRSLPTTLIIGNSTNENAQIKK